MSDPLLEEGVALVLESRDKEEREHLLQRIMHNSPKHR